MDNPIQHKEYREAYAADDVCPDCGGELNTGWECIDCGKDHEPLILKKASPFGKHWPKRDDDDPPINRNPQRFG